MNVAYSPSPSTVCVWKQGLSYSYQHLAACRDSGNFCGSSATLVFQPFRICPIRFTPWPAPIHSTPSVNLHISICTYMELDIVYTRIWSKYTAIYVLCVYACIYVYPRTVCICMSMYVYFKSNYKNTNIYVHIQIYIHIRIYI